MTVAINRCTKHKARHLVTRGHGFSYPHDILAGNAKTIRKWVRWADVVNCYICGSGIGLMMKAGVHPSKLMVTYLGTPYWRNPVRCHQLARKWGAKLQITHGAGLSELHGLPLVPLAVPVDDWRYVRRKWKSWVNRMRAKGGLKLPIVVQTPSSPKKKNTKYIRAALGRRKDIEFHIVRGSHRSVLRGKAKADIGIGPFTKTAFGLSGLEFLAMGIPLITHAKPIGEAALLKHYGELPYFDRPLSQLSDAVTELLQDRALLKEYAAKGLQYAYQFHDYPVVAKKFIALVKERVL